MSKELFFLISFALVVSLVGANVVFGAVWEGRIAAGEDDWEQLEGGAMRSSTSSDIEMPYEDTGQGDKQISGLRFIDVGIPAGSNITAAYLEFVVDETKGGNEPVSLLLEAEKTASAAPLSGSADVAGRPRTGAKVVWDVEDWTQAGQVSQSEDISSIIQELLQKRNGQPTPADGGMHEDTWASLSWTQGWQSGNSILMIVSDDPGNPSVGVRCAESFNGDSSGAALLHIEYTAGQQSAITHDVYLGENFDEVNEGAGDTFRGNQAASDYVIGFPGFPYPDGLVPGSTYYWRVDMVEADGTAHKGEVWSFSVPPKTAYSPDPADGAEFVDPDADFAWTPGFGAKLHTVYMGTNFDDVSNAAGGAPVGSASYSPGTLESEKVYYWRVDEFDPPFTHKGDVWSFTTPGAVGNAQPANGAVDVQMIETLSWTAADNAASHELYFGADAEAVKNATTGSPEYVGPKALGAESYDPGGLAWNSSYAWRVDEVYPTETIKGLVWSFTTADFILVDGFESYNDVDPPDAASNRIFDKWIDGFGTTTNGALVGNDLPPYAEQTIVHGGVQSLVYSYDNANKTSEATLTLVYPRDWTAEGVANLSLWVRGSATNAADRIYVVLNGTAAVYHDDPAATQLTGWNEWVIDLATFGVDLTNVNSIGIGVGTKDSPAAGGAGQMYFDDIRLVR